ncbi:hypothetical protein SteCoe_29709 [Stentor coeruleus]|uniref:Ig-like domain-containing protein n=1 Tax=Stentor coeruleus TaxID=5963 RepID=A0A1R2B5A9_9CILI|nr:hypothetical protein SteCoe_29709 [Stentor coeruleus]
MKILLFLFQFLISSVNGGTCTVTPNPFTVSITSSFVASYTPCSGTSMTVTWTPTLTSGQFVGSTSVICSNDAGTFTGYFDKFDTYTVKVACTSSQSATISITVNKPKAIIITYPSTVEKNIGFTIVIQVSDSTGVVDTGINSNFLATVSGTNLNTVSGTKSGGLYTCTNIMVSVASSSFAVPYTITDSSGLWSVTGSQAVKVVSADKFIVTSVPITYYTFFSSSISVSITDTSGVIYYTLSSSISLTESTSSLIGGGASSTSSTGTYSYTVHFITSGTKTLTFIYNSITATVTATVTKSVLKITVSATPTLSTTSFNVDVYVNNIVGGVTTNYVSPNMITLSLTPTTSGNSGTTLYGTKTGNTDSSAHIQFTSLKILSSGSFKITASATEITSIDSSTYTITNLVSDITLSLNPTTIHTYVNFDATINIIGEDGNNFLSATSVTLTDSSGYLKGLTPLSNVGGIATISNIYYSNYGTFSLTIATATPVFSKVFSITVLVSAIDLTFSTTPSDSLVAFTITATVKDVSGGTKIIANGPFAISMTLKPSGSGQSGTVWTYTSSQGTSSGDAIFSNLYIKSSGSFYIVATSTGFSNGQTSVFIITNHVKTITSTASTTSIDLFTTVTFTYSLIGDDDKNFILGTTVSIVASPSTGITSTTSTTITTGSVTLYSSVADTYSFQIATTSGSVKSSSMSIIFLKPNIVLTISTNPALSTTPFNIDVYLKNNANNAVLTNSGTLTFTFVMSCASGSTCSGLVTNPSFTTLTLTSGYVTISSVKILSSGKFNLKATYSTWTSVSVTTNTITNLASSITLSIPSAIYTYNNFDISATVTGEDGNNFILSCTLTLSDNSGGKFMGTKTLTSSSAAKTLSNLYYTGDGTFSIQGDIVEYSISRSGSAIVTASVIETTFTDTPADSSIAFTVTAKIKQTLGGATVTSNGPFTISLALVAFGPGQSGSVWTYASTQNTNLGEATFSNLKIKSSGNFYIVASCPEFIDSQSNVFTIKNHVKTITAISAVTSADLFTSVTITYTLKGDDDLDFILPTTVSVVASPSSGIISTTSTVVSSGSVTVSSSIAGTYSFEIATTSNSVKSASISITFLVPKIVLTLSVTPSLSSTLFNIYVNLKNNANDAVLSNSGILIVNLAIVCSSGSTCSGSETIQKLSTLTLTSGYGTLSSIKILSSGKFDISATYSTWTSIAATTDTITNLVSSLTFT